MDLQISAYNAKDSSLWDNFVLNYSENGTLFHTQKFLSYHPSNRFVDKSILIYLQNELVAVFLAAKYKDKIISHPGSSGGGLVYKKGLNDSVIKTIYIKVIKFYNVKITIQTTEDIYSKPPITLIENSIVEAEISMYFNLKKENNISNTRLKTGIKSCSNIHFQKTSTKEDYINFYNTIISNLERYDSKPTHSLEELYNLQEILADKMFLFLAFNKNKIVAGLCVIKVTSNAWHTQYIARDYSFPNHYVLSSLIKKLESLAKEQDQYILSLGSCNGGKSKTFSQSLYQFKKKLGAEKCYRYKIEIGS